MYKKLITKTAIQKNYSPHTPYKNSLNIYRGCEHACEYCYALYSHNYLNNDNFFGDIFYKENIVQVLEQELQKKNHMHDLVSVGTVCDSYQPCEKQMQFMPKVLDLFIRHKVPMYMSTKSNLILRDVDKLNELSQVVPIYLAMSITTLDDELAIALEPNASFASVRLKTAKILKEKTNAFIGLHIMPIIPNLTDSEQNLRSLITKAKEYNLDYLIFDTLNLYGETKFHYIDFLKSNFPQFVNDTIQKTGKDKPEYDEYIYNMIDKLKNEIGFSNKCTFNEYKNNFEQLSFF